MTHSWNHQQWQEEVVRPPNPTWHKVPVLQKNGSFASQGKPFEACQAAHLYVQQDDVAGAIGKGDIERGPVQMEDFKLPYW